MAANETGEMDSPALLLLDVFQWRIDLCSSVNGTSTGSVHLLHTSLLDFLYAMEETIQIRVPDSNRRRIPFFSFLPRLLHNSKK
ncbi:MAG: hypothetical protein PHN79_07090 [Methanoregula sp.]|nr:hypothetical protein [Methanoregula sp.]